LTEVGLSAKEKLPLPVTIAPIPVTSFPGYVKTIDPARADGAVRPSTSRITPQNDRITSRPCVGLVVGRGNRPSRVAIETSLD
jgi:hypothetical protein